MHCMRPRYCTSAKYHDPKCKQITRLLDAALVDQCQHNPKLLKTNCCQGYLRRGTIRFAFSQLSLPLSAPGRDRPHTIVPHVTFSQPKADSESFGKSLGKLRLYGLVRVLHYRTECIS